MIFVYYIVAIILHVFDRIIFFWGHMVIIPEIET